MVWRNALKNPKPKPIDLPVKVDTIESLAMNSLSHFISFKPVSAK